MKICLSIDGGGIKGLLPALILERLEEEYGAPAHNMFDLVCGVSTGGIIAGATSVGIPASDIVDLYMSKGPSIFRRSVAWQIKTLKGLRGPRYPRRELEDAIQSVVSDVVLDQINLPLLIPVQDMTKNAPVFVGSHKEEWASLPLKDIMVATSCAPTYFAPFKLDNSIVIDGGIVCNNPALYAYIEARKLWPEEDIFVLSLATAPDSGGMSTKNKSRWGFVDWAKRLAPIFMSAASDSSNHVMRHVMREGRDLYIRLTPPRADMGMDAASKKDIRKLLKLGEEHLLGQTINIHNIATFIKRLRDASSATVTDEAQS